MYDDVTKEMSLSDLDMIHKKEEPQSEPGKFTCTRDDLDQMNKNEVECNLLYSYWRKKYVSKDGFMLHLPTEGKVKVWLHTAF